MQQIQDAVGLPSPVVAAQGYVITLGNFDGVHMGHRALIQRAREEARKRGLSLLVFTFWPHSGDRVPGGRIQRIYTEEQKLALLSSQAPEGTLLRFSFDEELRTMPEETFFKDILCERYHAKALVVGDNFTYGYKGQGNVTTLTKHCTERGIDFYPVMGVKWKDERVSSTRIRTLLTNGKVAEAGTLLGQPYYIEGVVSHGKRLGRRLGFPTVNLLLPEGMIEPRHGVYVTRVHAPEGVYAGVTNVGVNPTVEHGRRCKAETHILDYEADLYDQRIRVEFLQWQRDERRFEGVEALREQLGRDIAAAREYTNQGRNGSAGMEAANEVHGS